MFGVFLRKNDHVISHCLLKIKEQPVICQVCQVFHGFQSLGGTYDPGRQQSNSIENNENLVNARFFTNIITNIV